MSAYPTAAAFGRAMLDADTTGERIAASTAWACRVYRSRIARGPDATTWVQIDLGAVQPIDAVRLYPSNRVLTPGNGFPARFRIECAEDANFTRPRLLADRAAADYPDPLDEVVQFDAGGITARCVRLTALRLREQKPPDVPVEIPGGRVGYLLSLAKIEVLSNGEDIALRRPVAVDATLGNEEDAQQLTRPARPQGEGVITDNPRNVTFAENWRPPHHEARSPRADVRLEGGIFQRAMERNVAYLMSTSSSDDLLVPFRKRAGQPAPHSSRTPHPFWEEALPGSSAGRFLMGAGNTLRWFEDEALRSRMNTVVEGVADCRRPNGYLMAYPEAHPFHSECGAYTRSWTTHGLIEAGYGGHPRAFELLRRHYDWFNASDHLPQMLRRCNQGGQGMVANTRLYFTPVGKPRDIQVIQQYFQENYWLDALASRDPDALGQYPYDRPHAYLLTQLEAYLDLYRATGEPKYLAAVEGGWDLFHDNWQNVGGSISLIEMVKCDPKSNLLYTPLGETCSSAFWILLNQRLHALFPQQERYVAEIEKSLYNVLLANQGVEGGIRYHSLLVGRKEPATCANTCCEGQGTRIIASLPEYIYSIAADGLYVNLYEPSTIRWEHTNQPVSVSLHTRFPHDRAVELRVQVDAPMRLTLHVRVPCWVTGAVALQVNGTAQSTGSPGTYVTLDRVWSNGDVVSFALPFARKLTRYTGADQTAGRERYALEHGPFLMAALDATECELIVPGAARVSDLVARLYEEENGHLLYRGLFGPIRFVPYMDVTDEAFSCFPMMTARAEVP